MWGRQTKEWGTGEIEALIIRPITKMGKKEVKKLNTDFKIKQELQNYKKNQILTILVKNI